MDLSNGMTMTDHQQELFDRIMSKGDHEGHPWMSHINNVEFLLAQKDFDINFTYYGQTPLWIACSLGILGCVTQLAEAPFVGGEPNPIDLEKPSSAGETPLYAACRAGHVKVAQYLVERVSKACLDAPTLDGVRLADEADWLVHTMHADTRAACRPPEPEKPKDPRAAAATIADLKAEVKKLREGGASVKVGGGHAVAPRGPAALGAKIRPKKT